MLIISTLLYRKQEQFLITIFFYHQLFSYGLPLETKCIESFHTLKSVLKKPAVDRTKNVKIFNYGSRRENIIHCQLRNESSDLKAHLNNQCLCQSVSCDNCGYPCKDNYPFFFAFPSFNIHRLAFMTMFWVLQT